jgi:NAD(P)-dependent dehydrogenase (short-subunit alcohol dehydrogenase family)
MEHQVIALAGQHTALVDEAARQIRAEGNHAVVLTWGHHETTAASSVATETPEQLGEAIRSLPSTNGHLDGLVFVMPEHNAHPASLSHVGEWATIQRGLSACLYANLAAADAMRRSGSGGAVVNVIPIFGVKAVSSYSFDSAAMGGAISLTKALGVEWAQSGVRVNAVLTLPLTASDSAKWRDERIPNRHLPTPAEVWEAVRYLLSTEARYVTGEALPADGGWLAHDYF